MVWGMGYPTEFGKYFPAGDFVGWDEDLTERFTKLADEDKAMYLNRAPGYAYYVHAKFVCEPGSVFDGCLPALTEIGRDEAPTQYRLEKNYPSLGSLTDLAGILAVDQPLKEIIERFEPGAHRFFPIEIVTPKNTVYPRQYFILVIKKYLDSFSEERSESSSWRRGELSSESLFFQTGKKGMSGLALSREKFGDANLWREKRMALPLVCFSDKLMSEIAQAGLSLPPHVKLKEI